MTNYGQTINFYPKLHRLQLFTSTAEKMWCVKVILNLYTKTQLYQTTLLYTVHNRVVNVPQTQSADIWRVTTYRFWYPQLALGIF